MVRPLLPPPWSLYAAAVALRWRGLHVVPSLPRFPLYSIHPAIPPYPSDSFRSLSPSFSLPSINALRPNMEGNSTCMLAYCLSGSAPRQSVHSSNNVKLKVKKRRCARVISFSFATTSLSVTLSNALLLPRSLTTFTTPMQVCLVPLGCSSLRLRRRGNGSGFCRYVSPSRRAL